MYIYMGVCVYTYAYIYIYMSPDGSERRLLFESESVRSASRNGMHAGNACDVCVSVRERERVCVCVSVCV